jgi:hypothetical protein
MESGQSLRTWETSSTTTRSHSAVRTFDVENGVRAHAPWAESRPKTRNPFDPERNQSISARVAHHRFYRYLGPAPRTYFRHVHTLSNRLSSPIVLSERPQSMAIEGTAPGEGLETPGGKMALRPTRRGSSSAGTADLVHGFI